MSLSMKDSLILERPHWFGAMTLENMDAIAQKVEDLLKGRRYTFVSVNELYGPLPRPTVRTSQALSYQSSDDGKAIHVWRKETFGGFNVSDTYGVWGCDTREDDDKPPYVVFEHDKIIIEQYAAKGNKVIWTVALEHGE